jgi:hypothetical protein
MATAGTRPKSAALRLVTGNAGKRPLPAEPPATRDAPLEPPRKLTKPQQRLWSQFIAKAWWLGDTDAHKAFMWVCLAAEHDRAPGKMIAARLAQLRVLGSEGWTLRRARGWASGSGRRRIQLTGSLRSRARSQV